MNATRTNKKSAALETEAPAAADPSVEPAPGPFDDAATADAENAGVPEAEEAPVAAEVVPAEETERSADEKLVTMTERYLRLQADFENFRKRTIRERSQIYKRANGELLEALLPTIDHLDLALGAVPDEDRDNAFVVGVRMVMDQTLGSLEKFGLTSLETAGKTFDPNVHEAIAHIPSGEIDENVVIQQTRRGFMLSDHLLRAAQVVVSSGAPEAVADEAPAPETEAKQGA